MNREEIILNRSKRKIEKLKQQRDHYKKENESLKEMLKMYPMIRYHLKQYNDMKLQHDTVRELTKRVQEQSLLIEKLRQCGRT